MTEIDCPREEDVCELGLKHERVNVVTGSRVHFGLLAAESDGGPSFGGCGVMVHRPSVWVQGSASRVFVASGQQRDRCHKVASRFARYFGLSEMPACELNILRVPNAHSGLGLGTQVDLAIASTLASLYEIGSISHEDLAIRIAGRGRRSAVGTHGFFRGGFIAESGVEQPDQLATLISSDAFPSDWRVMLIRPKGNHDVIHGQIENVKFRNLQPTMEYCRQALWGLLTLSINPAVSNADYATFSSAVTEYNYRSGLLFEAAQGGAYNGEQLATLVRLIKTCGCRAVGQSSWGPTLFAICESQADAVEIASRLHQRTLDPLEIEITRARNKPATTCTASDS